MSMQKYKLFVLVKHTSNSIVPLEIISANLTPDFESDLVSEKVWANLMLQVRDTFSQNLNINSLLIERANRSAEIKTPEKTIRFKIEERDIEL